jgi:hypothetical protein
LGMTDFVRKENGHPVLYDNSALITVQFALEVARFCGPFFLKRYDMFVFIVGILVIIGIILFLVFAAKKKKEGVDLGDRAANPTNEPFNPNP